MNATARPWEALSAGDRLRIRSHRGNSYELVFLWAGEGESGLLVRFSTGKLARFYPERLDWTTLERLRGGPPIVPGDEVLATRAGVEIRGRVLETRPGSLLLILPNAQCVDLPLDGAVAGSLWILFAATDWRRGDEFLVKSLSGREYRGRTLLVTRERIDAGLSVKGGLPSEESVSLRADQLYLASLRILIPVHLTSAARV
jgi:hypothetical protein